MSKLSAPWHRPRRASRARALFSSIARHIIRESLPDLRRFQAGSDNTPARVEDLEARMLLAAEPVISEFMAWNVKVDQPPYPVNQIVDEDGNYSDWIEVGNRGDEPLNLAGYSLTDNASNLDKWQFPSIQLAAGQYMVVWATGNDRRDPARPLHTNFQLNHDGGYLALVAPDRTTVLTEYANYPQQVQNISYGILNTVNTVNLLTSGSSLRVSVPTDGSAGATWIGADQSFDDSSWTGGAGGIGYETRVALPRSSGFTAQMAKVTGGTDGDISNIGEATSILDGTYGAGTFTLVSPAPIKDYTTVNLATGGQFTGDQKLPDGTANAEQYALRITADVVIPAGTWTIGVNSDDGFLLRIPGVSFDSASRVNENYTGTSWSLATVPADTLVYGGLRGAAMTYATFTVPAGGLSTRLQLDYFERTGGDSVELAVSSGSGTPSWNLLSDGLLGWSVKSTSSYSPPVFTGLFQTDVRQQMQNHNASAFVRMPFTLLNPADFDTLKLHIKYDDGFVAYINGQEVARRNAPQSLYWNSTAASDRPAENAVVEETIVIDHPEAFLREGTNILAIQALNDLAADSSFLLAPQLDGIKPISTQQRYFQNPTPRAVNDSAGLQGRVADTKFDHDRGFYEAPFLLSITTATPNATIRYTLDGSAPTISSGMVYTAPIPISRTTTVRTAAFAPGLISTDVDTQTYIFPDDVVKQPETVPTGWTSITNYGMDPNAGNSPPPSPAIEYLGQLFFVMDDGASGKELWRCDGTPGGTVMVADINPGPSSSSPGNLTILNGILYFTADNGTNGSELWRTDGSAAGTYMVADLRPGSHGSNPAHMIAANGWLWFSANDGTSGRELWRSDGNAPTLVADIVPGQDGSYPENLLAVGSTIYFTATDPATGTELWKTDGVSASLVADIWPGTSSGSPSSLTAIGNTVYFAATEPLSGTELWKSNGTAAGTVRVQDIWTGPDSSSPTSLTAMGGWVYFAATNASSGTELWKSDGTSAGTTLVKDIYSGSYHSDPYGLIVVNNVLYFAATDSASLTPTANTELWRSDGTSAGTFRVKDINASNGSNPSNFTALNGILYFAASDAYGEEPWRSDGTSAGTFMLRDINGGAYSSGPGNFMAAGGKMFFTALTPGAGRQLWATDGSVANTRLVRDIDPTSAAALVPDDLLTIPTISIVMNQADFNSIYNNPSGDGIAWEKLASIELINPDGSDGFQINGGIRIRGGYSRTTSNPKHGFHLFFRNDPGYGGKLDYPIFGDAGADEFEELDLRCAQNYSWSFEGDARGIQLRDMFSRDTMGDMGDPTAHGDFYYLYINGQFWGLYNTDERPSASNSANLYGGDKSDWDTIKVDPDLGYQIEAIDGDLYAWNAMWSLAQADMTNIANYERLLGNNSDGTRNPNYPVYVDVDNLIDYMLVIFYGGNLDAPLSNFLGNTSPNNFFAIRNRNGQSGFKFFIHDAEHTLLNPSEDRTGPYNPPLSVGKSNPQTLFELLEKSPEFRLRVADRIHKFFFNGGALTSEASINRLLARAQEIDRAVAAESARWGDSKTEPPRLRDTTWLTEITRIVTNYMPQRSNTVFNQLVNDNLYPTKANSAAQAPEFNQLGGTVAPGFQLTISKPGGTGTIYYTTDGTDPRLVGGAISSKALTYSGPITLNNSVQILARVRLSGGVWSALTDFTFVCDVSALRITEVMYNPVPPAGGVSEDYEYIEFQNTGKTPLNLNKVSIAGGVSYTFGNTVLAAGERIVVARNRTAFLARYPSVTNLAAGNYTGKLSDSGDTLQLIDAGGNVILTFDYKDSWYKITDGGGYSLVCINPALNPGSISGDSAYSDKSNWRPSNQVNGAPGVDDPGWAPNSVIINEILPSTTAQGGDWIELYNPTNADINIGGWFLSAYDDSEAIPNLRKYQFPANTIIQKGKYLVLKADLTYANPAASGVLTPFHLSSLGGTVALSSNDGANLGGYRESENYMAVEDEVSIGQYTTSTGRRDFTAMNAPTQGAANGTPRVGPIVINEMMYNPAGAACEFIELKNITGEDVPLYDPAYPANTWKFVAGIDFTFPQGVSIPAFGYLVLAPVDEATFRTMYNLPAGTLFFQWTIGSLDNAGEDVKLARPGEGGGSGVPAYILVDRVKYDNAAPWPVLADGHGPSLLRSPATAYGDDPAAWVAGMSGGSPGGQEPPVVSAGADASISAGSEFSRTGSFTDFNSDVSQTWTATVDWGDGAGQHDLPLNGDKTFTLNHNFPLPGIYNVLVTITDSFGGVGTDTVRLVVYPPAQVGTSGDDTFIVRLDDAGTNVEVVENGTTVLSIARAGLLNLVIDTAGGDDLLIVDASNGNPIPPDGISCTGGAGTDTLRLIGTSAADTISAAASSLALSNLALQLSGFEVVAIDAAGGDDSITAAGSLPYALSVSGGAGVDLLACTGTAGPDTLSLSESQCTIGTASIAFDQIESVTIDAGDSNDILTVSAALSLPFIYYGGAGVDRLIIAGGGGNDTFAVAGVSVLSNGTSITFVAEQLQFDGGDGDDTLQINGTPAFGILFNGSAGTDSLLVQGTSGLDYITLTATGVIYAGWSVDVSDVESAQINALAGDDLLSITAPPQFAASYDGGDGFDRVYIYGTTGNDTISATATAISFNGASIPIAHIEQAQTDGGAGDDAIGIDLSLAYALTVSDSSGIDTLVLTGTSGDDNIICNSVSAAGISIGASGFEKVQFDGLGGDDTLSITNTIPYAVLFNGGDGNDKLILAGTGSADSFTASATQLAVGTERIDINGVESAQLDAASGDDIFTVYGPIPYNLVINADIGNDRLIINGGSGNDSIAIAPDVATVGDSTVAYAGVEQLSITGGSGDDTFTVSGPLPFIPVIDGGEGSDQLLLPGTDGDDVLTLRASDNQISTGLVTVAQSGFEWVELDGGAGDDTLTVVLPLARNYILDGGSGDDRLIIDGTGLIANMTLNESQLLSDGSILAFGGVEQMEVDSSVGRDTLTIASALPFTPVIKLGRSDDVLNVQAGTIAFDVDLAAGTDRLTLNVSNSAQVHFNATQHLAGLSISDDARVSMASGSVLRTGSLEMSGGADLDLGTGTLIVTDASLGTISDAIASARNAVPSWSGHGITSSAAAATPMKGLAAMVNDDGHGLPIVDELAGEPVAVGSVIVKYTVDGDADLNGILDGSDYFFIDKGFLSRNSANPPTGYRNGDFNYDGLIDGSDYFLIDKAFLSQATRPAAAPLAVSAAPADMRISSRSTVVKRAWAATQRRALKHRHAPTRGHNG